MTTTLCRACRANPPAFGHLCVCCHRDHLAAQRAEQQALERARLDARRPGRRAPAWKPEPGGRGHGHGSAYEAAKRPVE
jgi:hypothetical protein